MGNVFTIPMDNFMKTDLKETRVRKIFDSLFNIRSIILMILFVFEGLLSYCRKRARSIFAYD